MTARPDGDPGVPEGDYPEARATDVQSRLHNSFSPHAMSQVDNTTVLKKANVYFDGKCVSHTVHLADGTRMSVGVVMPSTLTFNTAAPERMETVAGRCRVRLRGESEWRSYGPGESFEVPGSSGFDIEVTDDPYHYVCHFLTPP